MAALILRYTHMYHSGRMDSMEAGKRLPVLSLDHQVPLSNSNLLVAG